MGDPTLSGRSECVNENPMSRKPQGLVRDGNRLLGPEWRMVCLSAGVNNRREVTRFSVQFQNVIYALLVYYATARTTVIVVANAIETTTNITSTTNTTTILPPPTTTPTPTTTTAIIITITAITITAATTATTPPPPTPLTLPQALLLQSVWCSQWTKK